MLGSRRLSGAVPLGVPPRRFVLGTTTAVQTTATRDGAARPNSDDEFVLSYAPRRSVGVTCIRYGADAASVEAAVAELLTASGEADLRVVDTAAGAGTTVPSPPHAVIYTVRFNGRSMYGAVPTLAVADAATAACADPLTAPSRVVVDAPRAGVLLSPFANTYEALAASTAFKVREPARNVRGWSAPSAVADLVTPAVGFVPGPPTAVSLYDQRTGHTMGGRSCRGSATAPRSRTCTRPAPRR